MSNLDDIEFKIARLDLQPGDILVVKCSDCISTEVGHRIGAIVSKVAPGHKHLILEGGMDLEILLATEIAERTS